MSEKLLTAALDKALTRITDETPGSINRSQGCPEGDPPQILLEAMAEMSGGGEQHQYPVTFGSPNLRRCIAEKYSPILGRTIDPETEVTITCGGTEAMLCTVLAICNPGDKVIAFSPYSAEFEVAAGEHTVDIDAYINRTNGFGTLHCADEKHAYQSPNVWRTKGDEWCYEYRLTREGILVSPQFTLLK